MTQFPESTEQVQPVPRREVPPLVTRQTRVGRPGMLHRSYPTGHEEFFRIYDNEPLRVEIELQEDLSAIQLVVHTNLGDYDGNWREIPLNQVGSRQYAIDIPTEQCGLFRFKIKYSLDGGQNWYWDRVPYSEVLVDPASTRRVAMYTMIPSVSGHMGEWRQLLQRIREMGFDTVHLLPVTRMDVSRSPYAADNLFEIDPSYLDPTDGRPGLDQFEDFVETAKQLGLRLCFDLVLNHIGVSSKMAQACPGWIVLDESEPDGLRRAGCWFKNHWLKWMDLAKIHYDHPQRQARSDIWKYMTDYALFWGCYADYTGDMVRFDNLHSSHEGFITHCTRALRREYPRIVQLAEFFSDQQTLERKVPEWGLNLLLANPWEYRFAPQLREYIQYLHHVSGKLRHFVPITSHDTGSPAQEFGSPEATIARYLVVALFTTGQTGIVQGVEQGVAEKVDFIGDTRRLETNGAPAYSGFITKVNALLREREVFANSGNLLFVDNGHEAILAALRFGGFCGENDVLLLANLDTRHEQAIEIDLDALAQGRPARLRDMLGDANITPTEAELEITLGPSAVRALEVIRS